MRRIAASGFAVFWLCLVLATACSSAAEDEEIPLPALTPFSPELASRLHQIRDETAKQRQLPVQELAEEGTLSRDQLRDYYARAFAGISEDDRIEAELQSKALVLLHMIDADDNFLDAYVDYQAEGIAGFYVPTEKKMVLVDSDGKISISDQFILSHEYTHTLQQQWFDSPELKALREDEKTEYPTTIDCVWEGDAGETALFYMTSEGGPDWLDELGADDSDDGSVDDTPPALQRYMAFNYDECLSFVLGVRLLKGIDGVNALYDRPPATTEQVMHVEKYLGDERALDLAAMDLTEQLGSGWRQLDQGPFGEFDLYNYLLTIGGDEGSAKNAAAGWGNGWLAAYSKGSGSKSESAVHVSLRMDSARDLAELRSMLATGLATLGFAIGNPRLDDWSWFVTGEYGSVQWNTAENRVELFIGTSPESYAAAKAALQATAKP